MNEQVSIFAAFIAGVVSFLSPCVLPLVPAYISFITGTSLEELRSEDQDTSLMWKAFRSSLFFVLGFSTVFVSLGASATWLGSLLGEHRTSYFITIPAGLVIIIFGLHLMGVFKIGLLYKEKRFQGPQKALTLIGAFAMGLAFAFGWTPCIGPILGSILTYAGTQDTIWKGIFLLLVYSLGLGIPFLITALGINQFFKFFNKIKRYFKAIEVTSGVLLIFIGFLIMFGKFSLISSKAIEWFPFLNKFTEMS